MLLTSEKLLRLLRVSFMIFRWQLAEKYAGRERGWVWLVLSPLLQLSVFLAFFSIFFEAKWGEANASPVSSFILGLLFYWAVIECISVSVLTIRSNQHLITKVVFPVFVLPLTGAAIALLTFIIQVFIFLIYLTASGHDWTFTHLSFLWVILLFIFFIIASAFFFSWLGAVFRDLSHLTSIISLALMFLSPIFFSTDALPYWLQPYLNLNPLSFFIETGRGILLVPVNNYSNSIMIPSVIIALYTIISIGLYISGSKRYANVK